MAVDPAAAQPHRSVCTRRDERAIATAADDDAPTTLAASTAARVAQAAEETAHATLRLATNATHAASFETNTAARALGHIVNRTASMAWGAWLEGTCRATVV